MLESLFKKIAGLDFFVTCDQIRSFLVFPNIERDHIELVYILFEFLTIERDCKFILVRIFNNKKSCLDVVEILIIYFEIYFFYIHRTTWGSGISELKNRVEKLSYGL